MKQQMIIGLSVVVIAISVKVLGADAPPPTQPTQPQQFFQDFVIMGGGEKPLRCTVVEESKQKIDVVLPDRATKKALLNDSFIRIIYDPRSPAPLFFQGINAYRLNDFEKAEEILKRAMVLDTIRVPHRQQCPYWIGLAQLARCKYSDAAKSFGSVPEDSRFGPMGRARAVEACLMGGNIEGAESCLAALQGNSGGVLGPLVELFTGAVAMAKADKPSEKQTARARLENAESSAGARHLWIKAMASSYKNRAVDPKDAGTAIGDLRMTFGTIELEKLNSPELKDELLAIVAAALARVYLNAEQMEGALYWAERVYLFYGRAKVQQPEAMWIIAQAAEKLSQNKAVPDALREEYRRQAIVYKYDRESHFPDFKP